MPALTGAIFTIKHTAGANFTPVFVLRDPGAGIGCHDLRTPPIRRLPSTSTAPASSTT
jgi:hypothetical protein